MSSKPSLCAASGEFKSSKEYRSAFQDGRDFVVLDEVILEIEAQYKRFVELTGRQPGYFEGHAVASNNFFKGLEIVAQRHGAPHLPIDLTAPVKFCGHKVRLVVEAGLPDYDPLATLQKSVLDTPEDTIPMVVFHPGYLDAYLLRTSSLTMPCAYEVETACSERTKHWLEEHDVRLITYDDLNQSSKEKNRDEM